MNYAQFAAKFDENHKIGEAFTDQTAEYYFDNGVDVGVLRVDRRSTVGCGEILWPDDAITARRYFKK